MLSNGNGTSNKNHEKYQVPDGFIYPNLASKCTWKKPIERNPHTNRA